MEGSKYSSYLKKGEQKLARKLPACLLDVGSLQGDGIYYPQSRYEISGRQEHSLLIANMVSELKDLTKTQLIFSMHDVSKELNDGNRVDMVLLDLRKRSIQFLTVG